MIINKQPKDKQMFRISIAGSTIHKLISNLQIMLEGLEKGEGLESLPTKTQGETKSATASSESESKPKPRGRPPKSKTQEPNDGEAVAPTSSPPSKKVTKSSLQEVDFILNEVINTFGINKALEVLASFGVDQTPKIPKDKYGEVLHACRKVLQGPVD